MIRFSITSFILLLFSCYIFCQETGTVTDIDGNTYNTIRIGDQWWMAENLASTRYSDGTEIPLITDGEAWCVLSTPAYCWYDNNENTYKDLYGAIYNGYAAVMGNLCPSG